MEVLGDTKYENTKYETIYELHVKGFSVTNKNIPKYKRGKFLGVSDTWSIAHLKSLGVTVVQLMPVFDSEDGTYWHYGSCSWTRLNNEYGTLRGFKKMVKQLHSEGIKVVLDVVYNNIHGFKHEADSVGIHTYDWDVSGVGRTVDVKKSLPVIEKSMKYWLNDIGVAGMRFDLANILGREGGNFNQDADFFEMTKQFKGKMLIAEPWDCAEVSQGKYPEHFWELNGWFRDCVLSGNVYEESSLLPAHRSVNFITCHDNFTLEDFVSYDKKYNLENGEDDRDGGSTEYSCNHGEEGVSTNSVVLKGRKEHKNWLRKQLNNCKGHKMILMGDEESLCNSMGGNNNAYRLDNEKGWLNWKDYKLVK